MTVLPRPHVRLAGNDLYFLISRRPLASLSTDERAIWAALADGGTVGQLRTRFANEADRALRRFLDLEICDLVASAYPAGRRRILVFEPHSDDAVLSVGATMWQRRRECEYILVTIGSRSNFTSYYDLDRDFFNVAEISRLRDAEGALFMRALGGQYRALGLNEAALRYQDGDWSLKWFREHKGAVSAFIDHRSTAHELAAWKAAMQTALREVACEEVWFPLGSPHTDHQLTRDAALTLLAEDAELFAGRAIRFYQDVPYATRFPEFTATILDQLKHMGFHLVGETVAIDASAAAKRRLVSLYASQFKIGVIWPDVEASARPARDETSMVERFWRLEGPARKVDTQALRVDLLAVRETAERLVGWLQRHRNASRLRLLLLLPAGRWKEDVEFILDLFPKAIIDVFAAPAARAEVAAFTHPRLCVHDVGGGGKAWLLLSLRLAFTRPVPTLFVAGGRRQREARLLAKLWPLSDTVVVSTMDRLMAALRQLALPNTLSHKD